jgi:hypothetical protein
MIEGSELPLYIVYHERSPHHQGHWFPDIR